MLEVEEEQPKLRNQAYKSFTRHLLARDIHPGQFVSHLSLGAIRELIPRLEAEGLIKTVPQRGLQIAHIDLELVREAFQFRLFIEREAIALFCGSVSDAEGESAALEAQAQVIDWNMHNTIVAALNNKIIWRAYNAN